MKKLFFTFSILCLASTILLSTPVAPVNTMDVPMAYNPPVIDGVMDNVYSSLQSTNYIYPSQLNNWYGETDFKLDFAICWDYEYLYFYAVIQDDVEHSYWWDTGDSWTFDNVEVFLQLDTNTLAQTGSDSLALQIRICRGLDSVETPYDTRASFIYYMEAQAPGGWITEVAIPWTTVLSPSMEPEDIMNYIDRPIGFDVMGADSDEFGDTGARDFQTAWDLDGQDGTEDLAWNDCSVFGYINLLNNASGYPMANAGRDQVVKENKTVFLDGTSSYDPQGDELSYSWTAPAGINLSGAQTASPSFIAPHVDEDTQFTFGLTVSDGTDQSLTDYVNVTVINDTTTPVAQAGEDQRVYELSLVILDGSASSDPNADELSYAWTSLQDLPMLQAYQQNAMLIAPEVDTATEYQFMLVVSDGNNYSQADTVNLTVLNQTETENDLAGLNSKALQLYPNPASQFLNINHETLIKHLDLFDASGKFLSSYQVNAKNYRINVDKYNKGMYILFIYTEDKVIHGTFNIE